MNFGQAFSFPFEDPDWAKKLLIPGLIALIGIIVVFLGPIYLLGWGIDVTRRVLRHDPHPLPDVDFGRQLVDGLKVFVISFVYSIPVLIVSIPSNIAQAMMQNSSDGSNVSPLALIIVICCGGLAFILSILLAFVLPAALGNFVAKESMGAAFRFNEVIGLIRATPGTYLLVLVGMFVAGIISGLGVIVCVIGVIFTWPYAAAIEGYLYGAAYNDATRNMSLGATPGGAQVY